MKENFEKSDVFKIPDFPFHMSIETVEEFYPVHTHDFAELIIIMKGNGKHVINDTKYPIQAGDIFVIKGKTKHGFENSQGLEICNIMYNRENFLFPIEELNKMRGFQKLFILEPYSREQHQIPSHIKVDAENMNNLRQLILNLLNEYETRQLGFKTRITALFADMVVFLSRHYEIDETIDSRVLIQISDAITYMELNYLKQIKLEDIADKAFVSPSHFCRIFKNTYKVSPIDYVIKLRVWHACQILKFKDKSISQVAFESGFLDNNYFSRKFKKEMGMSPKEYRKKIV